MGQRVSPARRTGITVVEGDAFMIADPVGDVRPGTGDGLYHRDTRFLSDFRLLVNGRPPDLLAGGPVDAFSARIYLRPAGEDADATPIVIERRRFIGDGLHEDLVVTNHGGRAAELSLEVLFESDFADIFEVKRLATGRVRPRIGRAIRPAEGVIELWRRRRPADRSVVVRVMPEAGPELTRGSIATASGSRPARRGGPASTSFRCTRASGTNRAAGVTRSGSSRTRWPTAHAADRPTSPSSRPTTTP